MTNHNEQSSAQSPNFLLELGPLLAFFGMNYFKGIIWATGTLMLAMSVAMAISWKRHRKIPPMMLVTSLTVLFFGALTIYFEDSRFIKYKVTLVNFAFALILFVGLKTDRLFLKKAMDQALQLTDSGWRQLSARFAGFFLGLGILNELIWRNVSEDNWVIFKTFGLIGLTMLFMLSQMPFIQSVTVPQEEDLKPDGEA